MNVDEPIGQRPKRQSYQARNVDFKDLIKAPVKGGLVKEAGYPAGTGIDSGGVGVYRFDLRDSASDKVVARGRLILDEEDGSAPLLARNQEDQNEAIMPLPTMSATCRPCEQAKPTTRNAKADEVLPLPRV